MRFYFDKDNGKIQELTEDEVLEHMTPSQLAEGIEAKLADPNEEVSYMTVGGFIRIGF
jgi:hypothetical protein